MKIKSPIFVVGSPRSGTSLVYAILQSTEQYAIYNAETHLLKTCKEKYGTLIKTRNYENFLNNWIQSKQFRRSGLSKNHFIEESRKHKQSYLTFLQYFMEAICESQDKNAWIENTPNHVFCIPAISLYFPDSKFIHVIRDGRASSFSLYKKKWTGFENKRMSLIAGALQWQQHVLAGIKYGRPLENRYLEIHYEKLIENPEIVLKKISKFINYDITIKQLANSKYGALYKNNSVHSYTNSDYSGELFSKKSINLWRRNLERKYISDMNSIIGNTLSSNGYIVNNFSYSLSPVLLYCFILFYSKQFLKSKTILGKFSRTGLEK